MKGYRKYFLNKLLWFLVTFVFAFILNFILPRLMPGDPVAAIVSRMAQGMSNATGVQKIYQQYTELFGTNRPMLEQFVLYLKNVVQGNFIGVDSTGTIALGNGTDCCHSGIVMHLGASNNTIGGITPGAGNELLFFRSHSG